MTIVSSTQKRAHTFVWLERGPAFSPHSTRPCRDDLDPSYATLIALEPTQRHVPSSRSQIALAGPGSNFGQRFATRSLASTSIVEICRAYNKRFDKRAKLISTLGLFVNNGGLKLNLASWNFTMKWAQLTLVIDDACQKSLARSLAPRLSDNLNEARRLCLFGRMIPDCKRCCCCW